MAFFRDSQNPILTIMLKNQTPEALLNEITQGIALGAEAFGLQLETIPSQYRKEEMYRTLFAAMGGCPIYLTNYRRCYPQSNIPSDEILAEEILTVMSYTNNVLIDIPGDMFHPCSDEITWNDEAVKKQKKLTERIHSLGGEVLYSSHVLRYIEQDYLLRIAHAHEERGADIVKIVVSSETKEQLDMNLMNTLTLNHKISVPVLFLSNGNFSRLHRIYGPTLGSCAPYLVVADPKNDIGQPYIEDAKLALGLLKRHSEV